MKYIKQYESIENNKPKVGYYVLMKTTVEELKNFIDNSIGIIDSINFDDEDDLAEYTIRYENIPENLPRYFFNMNTEKTENNCRDFRKELMIEYAPTIEELKIKIQQRKYNL